MTDQQKAEYLADLYDVRASILAGMKSAKGKVSRMIDGQSVTYEGASALLKALRDVNAEIACLEDINGNDGVAYARFADPR